MKQRWDQVGRGKPDPVSLDQVSSPLAAAAALAPPTASGELHDGAHDSPRNCGDNQSTNHDAHKQEADAEQRSEVRVSVRLDAGNRTRRSREGEK
jgi:hypothetical protein